MNIAIKPLKSGEMLVALGEISDSNGNVNLKIYKAKFELLKSSVEPSIESADNYLMNDEGFPKPLEQYPSGV